MVGLHEVTNVAVETWVSCWMWSCDTITV